MAVRPLQRVKKVIKRRQRFTKFQFDRYPGKLKSSYRKPRGIDCVMRRQFRGNKPMVKVGYGNNKKYRDILPNGFKKLLIRNEQDIELLLMNNRTYCGELAANLSAPKRKKIAERAAQLNVRLTNYKGKMVTEEKKTE